MQSTKITINNTGDFLKVLKALLDERAGKKALVIYEGDIEPQDTQTPIIIVTMPKIDEIGWSDDGRHQDTLEVSILVKVPKNLNNAPVQCMNVAGFIRGLMTEQIYSAHIDDEFDHVSKPEDLSGHPLKWDTNEHGYEIMFYQDVRYGTLETTPFNLVGIDLKERHGDTVKLYDITR